MNSLNTLTNSLINKKMQLNKGDIAIFQNYANFYDIMYQDKDYRAECDFLELIFSQYSNKPIKTILDLGCGTGGHTLILTERGFKVMGIDLSGEMLEISRKKANERKLNIEFIQGDIRNLKLNQKFDAVISMFAVMSYQIANEDLISAFKTGPIRQDSSPCDNRTHIIYFFLNS